MLKKWKPWFKKPIKLILIKIEQAKPKVKIIWLVSVKLYGIIPVKLHVKRKICNKKIDGKYFSPFLPKLFFIKSTVSLYNNSFKACQIFGITVALYKLNVNQIKIRRNISDKEKEKFVIEKFNPSKAWIGNNTKISNCSKGL